MKNETATVIATYSRRMRLRLASGIEVDARIKGKRIKPVCGDRVIAESLANESEWLITAIVERENELARPNMRGQIEVLAANLDYLVVVAAAEPKADWYIVDRYLCAAELMGIAAAVVFNKIDLDTSASSTAKELADYARIGYDVIQCSAKEGHGTADIEDLLKNRCAIIVGQSGVGKSSIINQLVGDATQPTSAVSDKTREGRHTTVNSVMIPLPGGGSVIDSPGVRDYAPALESSSIAAQGFREITAAAQHCRFANCQHLREPGCAVKRAVEVETISARRYESYKRIVNLTKQLSNGRHN
ncbi:MAG: ribosome small subunit-dependent GTPase A [Gammaproteobacteria bacterium]|nr:ribosome small subunit-dependent GTPase A [Gammaproteobacteria bacterium]MBT8111631.1 ribosome small subunit-dependent GTPase A [Gammaproteobacteria bacterium]NND47807.1 ribosome small subunit-dependent GTPase A [Woeseiaceae bacterium]NNL46329.1 ribosome small subunit-dependent GTPase A [Woeseiaceae bacterium]